MGVGVVSLVIPSSYIRFISFSIQSLISFDFRYKAYVMAVKSLFLNRALSL